MYRAILESEISSKVIRAYAVFVDFKKAYDSVDREALFKTLQKSGVDKKTLKIIKET